MNNKNSYLPLFTLTVVLSAFILSGCGKQESQPSSGETSNSTIEAVLLDAKPSGIISVVEARKNPKPGTKITVVGRVAGANHPFAEEYATLVLADNTLETCDLIPGDKCSMPWDACCVPSETISSLRLSVQVLGDGGRPISQTLKGVGGLKELDEIVVVGTVAEGSTAENMILTASGIYLSPM